MEPERRKLLEQSWEERGIDPSGISVELDGTVLDRVARDTRPDLTTALPILIGATGHDELELRELISEGGMGRVHVGMQTSMQREVAVKRIRPGLGEAATSQLLKEARVTGALQHPAIVPVHGLGVDSDGSPLIVMKRLAGETWAERLTRTAGHAAALDQNLAVLEQVANAVAFAHSRGVMHRDIKPENVMLGDYGEVYLVDWGLALDLGTAGVPGLPLASDAKGIAGTLQYMAPEQALGKGAKLGTHTDVFQLGATLLEVLSGRTPHTLPQKTDPNQLSKLFYDIFTFQEPPVPDWVPAELATICREALALDAAERPTDAVAFRDAIARFRAHRDSMLATERAERRVALAVEHGDVGSDEVGALLAEARFGYEQALRTWPDNPDARSGLDEALVRMVERELALRRPDSAQTWLHRLEGRRPDLDRSLEELRAEITARRKRVDALETAAHESDLSVAALSRRKAGLAFAALFFSVNSGAAWLERLDVWELDHALYLVLTSAVATVFGIPSFLLRKRLFPNTATWRLVTTLAFMLLGQVAAFCAMWAYGMAFQPTLVVTLFPLATAVAIKTYLLEKRVFWATFAILGFAGIAVAVPVITLEMVGMSYAAYFIGGAALSWDPKRPPQLLEDVRRSSLPASKE